MRAMTVMTVRTMYKRVKKVFEPERQHMHVRRTQSTSRNGDMTLLGASKLVSAASVAGYRKGMF